MCKKALNPCRPRFVVIVAVVVGSMLAAAIDIGAGPLDPPSYEDNEIIVGLDTSIAGVDSSSIGDVNRLYGTQVMDYLQQLEIFKLSIDSCTDLETISKNIAQMNIVDFAHPNYLTDSLNSIQGSFPIVDERPLEDLIDQWAYDSLKLGEAHTYAKGRGVTVAVIDGGVDYGHPLFANCAIALGYDYVDVDSDPMDEPGGCNYSHGTFIAGVVNLTAPDAKIMAYRVATPGGRCNGFTLAKAMLQAVVDGCHVINLTFAMHKESMYHAMERVIDYANSSNVVVVAGAGNAGEAAMCPPLFPASDKNVIAVAAIDKENQLAGFSHYGEHIDVCAPGVHIHSAFIDTGYTTADWSGTCFSSSFVAGQAALIISRYPTVYTCSFVRNAILSTAENIDKLNLGLEGMLGEGCVNPVASLSRLLWPDSFYFEMKEGCNEVDTGCAYILFPGDPAPFSAAVIGDPVFVLLLHEPGGEDWFCFEIDGHTLPPGEYRNDLRVQIQGGVPDSVAELPVYLTVQVGDSALISPDTLFFSATEGDSITQFGESYLTSSNAPSFYSGWIGPSNRLIIDEFAATGYTNDSVGVHVSSGGLSAGAYSNTIWYAVDGFDYDVPLTVCLNIGRPRLKGGIDGNSPVSHLQGDILSYDRVAQNYPNPFNPTTVIHYDLAAPAHVRLDVFNVLGQRVVSLVDEFQQAGRHEVEWSGKDDEGRSLPSGLYFYRVATDSLIATKKMMILR